tara:strand:+ start:143 stop:292 length:150 start_codon:yes stop_codon:yes gene_type:complete
MPYQMIKLPNKNKYKVKNTSTNEIKSHSTSKKKAENQIRLLNMIDKRKK